MVLTAVALTPTIDSYIRQDTSTTNYGSAVSCFVQNMNGIAKRRGVVAFDLSSLPANAAIVSATLQLECAAAAPGSGTCTAALVPIGYTDPDIVESEVTWEEVQAGSSWFSAGGDTDPGVAWSTFDVPTSTGLMPTIDVKTMLDYARATYNYPTQFALLIYQSSGTNRSWTFASKENVSGQQAPTLNITYSTGIAGGILLMGDE